MISSGGGGGGRGGRAVEMSAQFFRFPIISFIYERGWRQSFSPIWGFPGAEKELELMKEYLKPVSGTGVILDASCGSGLLSRRFARSGLFSKVIALDFSEAMLQQCYDFIKREKNFPEEKIILVRADISRLPFASSSIDAVHAGAALHCWPSPSSAVQEIRRVLKPGGVFVATTVILDGALCCFFPPKREKDVRLSKYQVFRFFRSEQELQDLCASAGFVNYKCFRNRGFVLISAMK